MAARKNNDHTVFHYCGHRYNVPDPHSTTGARLTSAAVRNFSAVAKVAGGVCSNCQQVMALEDLIDLTSAASDTQRQLRAFQKLRQAANSIPNTMQDIRNQLALAGRLARTLEATPIQSTTDRMWAKQQLSQLLGHTVDATKLISSLLADFGG